MDKFCLTPQFRQSARKITVHIPLISLIKTEPGPRRPDHVGVETSEYAILFSEEPVKPICPRQRVIVILVPCELEQKQIAVAGPLEIAPFEKSIVKRLEIIQPPLPEHHFQPISPSAAMFIGVDDILNKSSRFKDCPEPAHVGLTRFGAAGNRGERASIGNRDIAETKLPRVIRQNYANWSDTGPEELRAAEPMVVVRRSGR